MVSFFYIILLHLNMYFEIKLLTGIERNEKLKLILRIFLSNCTFLENAYASQDITAV